MTTNNNGVNWAEGERYTQSTRDYPRETLDHTETCCDINRFKSAKGDLTWKGTDSDPKMATVNGALAVEHDSALEQIPNWNT